MYTVGEVEHEIVYKVLQVFLPHPAYLYHRAQSEGWSNKGINSMFLYSMVSS